MGFGLDEFPLSSVRWYFYKDALGHGIFKGSTASALTVDVPRSGTLCRFCSLDSTSLERAYRLDRDNIETSWWEEEAKVLQERRGGGSAATSPVKGASGEEEVGQAGEDKQKPVSPVGKRQSQSWADFIGSPKKGSACHDDVRESIGILVRGKQFEVDLRSRLMQPCYWPGRKHRVVRGTWFLDKQGEFLPLREAIAERLEQAFVSRVWDPSKKMLNEQRDGRLAARVELGSYQGSIVTYALFYSGYDIYLVEDTSFAWIKKKLSKSGGENRFPIRRGYVEPPTEAALKKEANLEEEKEAEEVLKRPTPSALVLAVHGIGQNVSGANIIQDAIELKGVVRKAEAASQCTGRIEVLPVQWRKTLNLEIDSLASSLMPPGIASLRHVLHSTAVEVLFYLTPMHRAAILDSVVNSLNVVYRKFLARNPDFQGNVSIFAHSLGSVLSWDVLCNQGTDIEGRSSKECFERPDAIAWAPDAIDIGRLAFEVDQFIIAGSPLGCFLALRGVNQAAGTGIGTAMSAKLMHTNPCMPGSPDGLPKANRMFNVYHPYDPVAYRLEPLAYPAILLEGRKHALVELFGGGRRIHIAAQELSDNVSAAASRFGSSIAGYFSTSGKKNSDQLRSSDDVGNEDNAGSGDAEGISRNGRSDSLSNVARIAGGKMPSDLGRPTTSEGRIDFALQEASLEHQYLAALGCHFSYWNNEDVGLFVYRAVSGLDVISGQSESITNMSS